MAKGNSGRSGGIGFFGLLTIVFIVMKLMGKITWAWYWVLAPLWAPLATILVIALVIAIGSLVVMGAVALFVKICEKIDEGKKEKRGK